MMKYLFNVLFIFYIAFYSHSSFSSEQNYRLLIVANIDDPSIHLTRTEVRNLFMGSALKYDLHAVILPPESNTRVIFNTKVVGLTESRIQSYWAQMRFSGRKKEPKQIANEQEVIEYLMSHQGAITYLSAEASIPKELTVLLKIR